MVEQVYIHVDYILELLNVVLTNITMVQIRYSGEIIKFHLLLVLFSELLLKYRMSFVYKFSLPFGSYIETCTSFYIFSGPR